MGTLMVNIRDKRALGILSARPKARVKELIISIRLKDERHACRQLSNELNNSSSVLTSAP